MGCSLVKISLCIQHMCNLQQSVKYMYFNMCYILHFMRVFHLLNNKLQGSIKTSQTKKKSLCIKEMFSQRTIKKKKKGHTLVLCFVPTELCYSVHVVPFRRSLGTCVDKLFTQVSPSNIPSVDQLFLFNLSVFSKVKTVNETRSSVLNVLPDLRKTKVADLVKEVFKKK